MPTKTKEQEAFEAIEQGVKDVYTSDNFRNYLKFLSKFHQYSLNNTILILTQYPEASLIAGYTSWKSKFNRQVNKGEQAIQILAPYQIKIQKENDSPTLEQNDQDEIKITKFRMVNVFDISQTKGEPIPEFVTDLKGTSLDAEALISSIREIATIPIEFKSLNEDSNLLNGAKGYYHSGEDKIVINNSLDTIQIAKTLVHEYAHSLLHKQTDKSREQKEIEAESLAFVICNHFNIDTSDYSFGYIASYTNQEFDVLKEVLANIQGNVHEIIETIEPEFFKQKSILSIMNQYKTPIEMESTFSPFINELETELLKTGLYDYLTSKDADSRYGREYTMDEINNCYQKLSEKYPGQCFLIEKDISIQQKVTETIYQHFYANDFNVHPFIDMSLERNNYKSLQEIANPILQKKAYYMKYSAAGMEDLNIEDIGENKIAMSHYYELNGDLMADPDIELLVDHENKLLIPQSYQMDSLEIYQNIEYNPTLGNDINPYLAIWIQNIKDSQYKLVEVKSDSFELNSKENSSELMKYCKDNDITKMMTKRKELER